MTFTAAERDYLSRQRLGRIATAGSDGEPDVAAVGFVLDGDQVVIGGLDISRTLKHRNIRQTGRAAFVVDDLVSVDPWRPRGVKVVGEASVVERPSGRAAIRIEPQTVWSWGINAGATPVFANIEKRAFDEAGRPAD